MSFLKPDTTLTNQDYDSQKRREKKKEVANTFHDRGENRRLDVGFAWPSN